MIKNRAFFAVFLALATAGLTNAQAATNTSCDLPQAEFAALLAVQNDKTLSYLDGLRAELRIRKNLLSKTVGCAIQKAIELRADLRTTSTDDGEVRNAQTQTINRFDGAITYYELEKSKIQDLGLEGSKKFAANLEEWRAGNFAPVARKASNIMLWTGNQNLIVTARSRINQMGNTIGLLNLVGNEDLRTLWNDAQKNFKTTLALNQSARDALIGAGDADQTLDLIKSSLDSLSVTYQKLFALSNALMNNPEE